MFTSPGRRPATEGATGQARHRWIGPRGSGGSIWGLVLILAAMHPASRASAAELDDAEQLLKTGEYGECIAACASAIQEGLWSVDWRLLKIKAELATGQYAEALETYETAAAAFPTSVTLRLVGYDVLRANDRAAAAEEALRSIQDLAARETWRYSDAVNRVAIGRALLMGGVDARQVLELFFDPAKKSNTVLPEPHLAAGELALEKHDFALAVEAFGEAAKRSPDDPDVHFGLARAYEDDAVKAAAALAQALELNSRHVPSLLMQVDGAIDAEDFERAEAILSRILTINPKHPRAWACRAVVAHLLGDAARAEECREQALRSWPTNPEVDHTIGLKLSRAYRFEEGAAHQRAALGCDPRYRPAKLQLGQDLLRLGQEQEGWSLAAEAFDDDKYNVVAFNLSTLHDHLAKFQTLEDEDFILRMESREAQLYGQRALRLLKRAKASLCEKYAVRLPRAIVVEVFPQQSDFAIRTFGLPGGAGFLGVCFGGVITANSPASQGDSPANWEAVLWHEFCHVVTLAKTRNRIPRWLSEGISVYEERQARPSWGQSMNPRYRERILAGDFTPVSRLSGAFMNAKSGADLRFAYYESSMAVEYLVGRFSLPALLGVLDDLREGLPINAALARRTEPLEELDGRFAAWLRQQAEAYAPTADWRQPELPPDAGAAEFAQWNADHPRAYWGLVGEGRAWAKQRDWTRAAAVLEAAAALVPQYGESDGAWAPLAAVHREAGNLAAETAALEALVALAADAAAPRLRLAELAVERGEWSVAAEQSAQSLAVNPLAAAAHRQLAEAAEHLGDHSAAIEELQALVALDPIDRAEVHFRLARQYWASADDSTVGAERRAAARRNALMALDAAPRFAEAHRLLLEIVRREANREQRPAGAAAAVPPAAPPAQPAATESDAAAPGVAAPRGASR